MADHKRSIIDQVLKNPIYREAIKSLPASEVAKVEQSLEAFVDGFSLSLIKTVLASSGDPRVSEEVRKGLERMGDPLLTGSVDVTLDK